ncbi:WD40 repeat-like protein, partial [Athelia psychrophila]
MIAAGTREGSVAAWSVPDGRKRLRLRKVHQESVRAIAFYPDGTRLVTASRDATLLVLCASSGRVLVGPLHGHNQCIISVAISPDGSFIFSGDKTGVLRSWCAKTGSMLPFWYRNSSPINSISFSHDGKWVVCGSATRAFRTDYRRPGMSLRWYREVPTVVRCIAFSPDGQMVAAGTRDGSVATWSIPDGHQGLPLRKVHKDSVRAIAFYPDGTRLVTASRDTTLLVLCPFSGSVLLCPLRGHTQCIVSVAISPDGCFIFSGDKAGVLRCWCAKTGAMLAFHYRSSSPINSISFSHDGKWVVCGSARLLFFEWQAEAGKWHFADYETKSFREAKDISSVALFPGDNVIVCAAGNRVQMWTVKGKEVAKEFDMSAKVHSISTSPDGRHFVSGSARGELCICDMRDRKRVATTKVINPSILTTASDMDLYTVVFSPDGKYI